ncbi:Glutamyl-tRNA synthetase [hydrothermal vent metagenome]|uniref:glutamate--tRNA ligase n=1 Tax=hydrothermal vent metagenome TaxID=652676 RepID=A0A3B0SMW9_9ZZZZ
MTKVVTRFAPSPTGYLHIGGARTALFNMLFARHHGGQFLLRIEDTDQSRSSQSATEAIISGLNWLGLQADKPPVFQSNAIQRHVEIAKQLLREGKAYPCYLSANELEQEKQQARLEKRKFQSPWRNAAPKDRPQETGFVIRLKTPVDGQTVVDDQVQGRVLFQNRELDDLVLLRADETPTYMLAVVVDDHDMGVTHVIRGDDHLVNAARQNTIYAALAWDLPVYAHIPLIHGPDGKKLSKRHGALGVEQYRDMGYLPEALLNYLLRLGWAHGDQEFFTPQQAIEAFSFDGINKGPSRLDFDKMSHVNGHYLKLADPARLAELVFEFLETENGLVPNEEEKTKIQQALPFLVSRANLLPELVQQIEFLILQRPISRNKKANKAINEERLVYLQQLSKDLAVSQGWDTEQIHIILNRFAEKNDIGFGKFGPILRAAISGGTPAPDLALACSLLGKDETLGRIDDLLVDPLL